MNDDPDLGYDGVTLGNDEAKYVKSNRKQDFDYVIMNPPYINKGIQENIMDIRSIPFYNKILGGGDVNYFHAFIKLANYFVKEGGRVSLICPLQLYGDRSSGMLRKWLSSSVTGSPPEGLSRGWKLNSLTRFYDRTVLFENVLQAVCISSWDRIAADTSEESSSTETEENTGGENEEPATIKVAGGWDIKHAKVNYARHESGRVVNTVPESNNNSGKQFNGEWANAWAVVVREGYLQAWERLKEGAATDLAHWQQGNGDRLTFRQGDVNKTRTKPLRHVDKGGAVDSMSSPIPTAGGKDTLPFGPYNQNGEIDADADTETERMENAFSERQIRNAERERRERVKRLHNLEQPEAVCVLKEVSGIEPARPIRGALYHRGGDEDLICFEHTTQVVFAEDPDYSYVTEALFGLLVSSVSNFIFSLFSTNQHVGTYEIKRLLVPPMDRGEISELARLARHVQLSGEQLWKTKEKYGSGASFMDVDPDATAVLHSMSLETETLQEAILRGHLSIGGRDWHLSTLLERGSIKPLADYQSEAYRNSINLLLSGIDERQEDVHDKIILPIPSESSDLIQRANEARQEILMARNTLFDAIARLDRFVLGLFGIYDMKTCRIIGHGMPWASQGRSWANSIAERLSPYRCVVDRCVVDRGSPGCTDSLQS